MLPALQAPSHTFPTSHDDLDGHFKGPLIPGDLAACLLLYAIYIMIDSSQLSHFMVIFIVTLKNLRVEILNLFNFSFM